MRERLCVQDCANRKNDEASGHEHGEAVLSCKCYEDAVKDKVAEA